MDFAHLSGPTVADSVAQFEARGYRGQFRAEAGGRMRCLTCNAVREPGEVRLVGLGRAEGGSDPGDEAVVAALQCPCGARGTEVFTFGSAADPLEMEAFRGLDDVRTSSTRSSAPTTGTPRGEAKRSA